MKVFRLPQLSESNPGGECLLGRTELGTDSVRFIYGRLGPGEKGRHVSPPESYEGVLHVIKGSAVARIGKNEFPVSAGEAFYSKEGFYLDNSGSGEVLYTFACGRSCEKEKEEIKSGVV